MVGTDIRDDNYTQGIQNEWMIVFVRNLKQIYGLEIGLSGTMMVSNMQDWRFSLQHYNKQSEEITIIMIVLVSLIKIYL